MEELARKATKEMEEWTGKMAEEMKALGRDNETLRQKALGSSEDDHIEGGNIAPKELTMTMQTKRE